MMVMSFDLADELPPVIFTLNIEDAERFESFMHECEQIKNAAQRTWVGLTDVEIVDIMDAELTTQNTEHFALCQAIEAKLKEKNT